jgi:L-amino acid N-acyltransferase YncA
MIREAKVSDWEEIWPIFKEVVRRGDTYAFDSNIDKHNAFQVWMSLPCKTYVYVQDNKVLGTYYLKPNQAGPGSHVCNCGYMVAENARGKGIARQMCEHSQLQAISLGYRAMQFNCVVSSNTNAIALWHKLGFKTVGTLPNAFNHPSLGFIDAFVMYKELV